MLLRSILVATAACILILAPSDVQANTKKSTTACICLAEFFASTATVLSQTIDVLQLAVDLGQNSGGSVTAAIVGLSSANISINSAATIYATINITSKPVIEATVHPFVLRGLRFLKDVLTAIVELFTELIADPLSEETKANLCKLACKEIAAANVIEDMADAMEVAKTLLDKEGLLPPKEKTKRCKIIASLKEASKEQKDVSEDNADKYCKDEVKKAKAKKEKEREERKKKEEERKK